MSKNRSLTLSARKWKVEYLPDEAIAARELMIGEELKQQEAQRKLDFWKGVELITAGPSQEQAQQTDTQRSRTEGCQD